MSEHTLELIQGEEGLELPAESGNWVMLRDHGYSPVQSLVAAAGACGAYVYQSVLFNSKVPYTFEKILIDYTRDTNLPSKPLNKIEMTFYLSVPPEFQDKAIRALRLIERNCPVIQSLDPKIHVTETVSFV